MAALSLTAPSDVLLRLPDDDSVTVSVVRPTATPNEDGTWTVTVYAPEDQIPAIESLGCTVRVVEDDASLLARWQEIQVHEPPIA